MKTEVRISGFGGQGVGLAGHIIGKALAIYAEKEAVMTQSYGPEARGGASNADIVISDQPIDYPFIHNPDILIALSQEAYTTYRSTASENAQILIDSGLVTPFPKDITQDIPATQLAETLGNRIVANIIMLGFFTAVTQIVNRKLVEQSIKTTVKSRFVDLNLNAFDKGYCFHQEVNK